MEKVSSSTGDEISSIAPFAGDYQFDIYRLMKKHNNGDWESFAPLTNVMVRQSF